MLDFYQDNLRVSSGHLFKESMVGIDSMVSSSINGTLMARQLGYVSQDDQEVMQGGGESVSRSSDNEIEVQNCDVGAMCFLTSFVLTVRCQRRTVTGVKTCLVHVN